MSDPASVGPQHGPSRDADLLAASTILRLCEEMIALREHNVRQHKMFEQTLTRTRDELKAGLNTFASDTHRAYQQLRQEFHGEKRIGLAILSEIIEIAFDLDRIVAARPPLDDKQSLAGWMDSVEVESRKVEDALRRLGVHPYDAVIGSPYNPALHERVGSTRVEGMGPLLVAEQRERGYASQQPEFVLRRPKVLVSE
jgi:molecular chaperone GrpE (heat shock protein)